MAKKSERQLVVDALHKVNWEGGIGGGCIGYGNVFRDDVTTRSPHLKALSEAFEKVSAAVEEFRDIQATVQEALGIEDEEIEC